jgi:hypothetical protein
MAPDQLRIGMLLSDVGRAQGLFFFWPAVVSILPHALGTVGWLSPRKHTWKVHWLILLYGVDEKFLVILLTSGPRIDSGHPRYETGVVTTWSWRSVLTGCRNLRRTICMKCGQGSSFGCHRELYQACFYRLFPSTAGMHKSNPVCKVTQATKFYTVALNVWGYWTWNLLHVILLTPRILRWIPDFLSYWTRALK